VTDGECTRTTYKIGWIEYDTEQMTEAEARAEQAEANRAVKRSMERIRK